MDPLTVMRPRIEDEKELIFGKAPAPVECGHGLVLGGGEVYPEINFTLPSMNMDPSDREPARRQYQEMITQVCQRAVELQAPGILVEIELLPPMTMAPDWGAETTALVRKTLDEFHSKHGLCSALRLTPVDVRDNERPPRMRSGELTQLTLRTFELCAQEGADLLSIESTGGKEVHDVALLNGDLAGVLFALGVLGVNDMNFLWGKIGQIAKQQGCISAGDTACGFANTAMVLADKGMISRVFASVVRVVSAVRSLQAYHQGAVGPSKDCAYEGSFLKAFLGIPISMEGKSSACAHLSHLGNIASACCDIWSNESVQNVRLLSASAPVVSMEQLVYDCRLMNQATSQGKEAALQLRDWMVESDASLDPQAHVLRPDVVVRLAKKMAEGETPLAMARLAAEETLVVLHEAFDAGKLKLNTTEQRWLALLDGQVETLPEDEETLATMLTSSSPDLEFLPEEYGL